MPEAISAALSLDESTLQPASHSAPPTSDLAYLTSVGLIAAVIIGVFFDIGYCLLTPLTEQIIGQSVTGDRVTTTKPLRPSVFPHQSDASSVRSSGCPSGL